MNMHAALPQLPFSEFDGSSPRLWRKKCETYFELYAVPKSFRGEISYHVLYWPSSLLVTILRGSQLCPVSGIIVPSGLQMF